MKRRLYNIILLVAVTLSGMAQNIGEAFYIYRNDGEFNAFFRDEVQSIEYSYEDKDGNTYDEIVTQIVTTADSVYLIPLAAIDSVAFVQPETKYNSSVIQLDQLLPYVVSTEGLQITFSSNIPSGHIPHSGDVLFYGNFQDPFPNGFAGVVESVVKGNVIMVNCTQATLDDIFDQVVECLRFGESLQQANGSRRAAGDYNPDCQGFHVPLVVDGSVFGANGGSFEGDIYIRTSGRWTRMRQEGQETYSDLAVSLDITTDAKTILKAGVNSSPDFSGVDIPFPLPFGLNGHFTLTPEVSVTVDAETEAYFTSYHSITIGARNTHGNQLEIYTDPRAEVTNQELRVAKGKIDFFVGGRMALGVGFAADIVRLDCGISAGFHAEGEIGLGSTEIDINDNYALSKDDRVTTSLRVALNANAGLYAGKLAKLEATLPLWNRDFFRFDHYVLPFYGKPSYTRGANKSDVEITLPVSRDLLGRVGIGISLYDDHDNLVETKFDERPYRVEREFANNPVVLNFSGVDATKKYKAYPVVKVFDQTYRATPFKQIGTPIIINQTEAIGKCGGEVTFKADLIANIAEENDEGITGRGMAICYGDEIIKEYAIDLSNPYSPIEMELVCHSDSLTEDWENYVATTANLWTIITYADYNGMGRVYYQEEAQPLEFVYNQKPRLLFLDKESYPTQIVETSSFYDEELEIELIKQEYQFLTHTNGTYWWDYVQMELDKRWNNSWEPETWMKDTNELDAQGRLMGWHCSGLLTYSKGSNALDHYDTYIVFLRNGATLACENYLHFISNGSEISNVEVSNSKQSIEYHNVSIPRQIISKRERASDTGSGIPIQKTGVVRSIY